ncbi:MAG: general secretion pathway protein GspK [Gammaproteobacteria bacterium]
MDFRASLASQRGSALIFAVGLCTLVVILATSMILALHHDMRRFERLTDTITELAAARSATSWAISVLADEDIKDKTEQRYEISLNGAQVQAELIDIDGLFNVNTLLDAEPDASKAAQAIFTRLLESMAISDKIVPKSEQEGNTIVLLSQMKQTFSMSEEMYIQLLPYVRANVAGDRAMNINTMPAPLLAAVLDVEEAEATAVLNMGPFESESEVSQALAQLSIPMPEGGLSQWIKFTSQQYLVDAQIKAKGSAQIYTLLAPQEKGWRVVYQSTGVRI